VKRFNHRSAVSLVLVALIAVAVLFQTGGQSTGQPPRPEPAKKVLIDPSDTVILLLDHQSGLFQTVKDVPVAELRTNTVVLAKLARLAKVPLITTASEPNGPNGPLMHELQEVAPDAIYVPRKGEISAWDNEDFVKTVKSTGRKTLVIAGVWTSVCVAFPALQAKVEGYNVYFVTDASGDPSPMASQTTIARLTQAGSDFYRMNGAGELLEFSTADFADFLEPRPDLPRAMAGQLKQVVTLLVKHRWPFRLHATYDESISRFRDVFEAVNHDVPFGELRWFFDHANGPTASHASG
jgi:nicotinamidase-related amidase